MRRPRFIVRSTGSFVLLPSVRRIIAVIARVLEGEAPAGLVEKRQAKQYIPLRRLGEDGSLRTPRLEKSPPRSLVSRRWETVSARLDRWLERVDFRSGKHGDAVRNRRRS